jgi:hypothetical protein
MQVSLHANFQHRVCKYSLFISGFVEQTLKPCNPAHCGTVFFHRALFTRDTAP